MPTKTRLRLKKKVIYIGLLIIFILISTFGYFWYKNYSEFKQYEKTNEYKLINIGYSKEEALIILKNFNEEELPFVLDNKKNSSLVALIQEKYFLKKNFTKYLDYLEKNKNVSIKDTVSLVNVGRSDDYYKNKIETDIEKGILINVNKYYYVNEDYVPNDLENISIRYSYAGNKLVKEANKAFYELCKAAEKEEFVIVVDTSYRSYKDQVNAYKQVRNAKGEREADKVAARAGHSDHQTGLAVNLKLKNVTYESFDETDGFKWLEENAQNYGFILRYPKDKEDITGFPYESSHYRYVGVEVAKQIKEENITFDEYYAFYVDN